MKIQLGFLWHGGYLVRRSVMNGRIRKLEKDRKKVRKCQ
jgi:hypothetical protein